jgi:hypothetical protein
MKATKDERMKIMRERERPHAGVPRAGAGEDQTLEQQCLVVAALPLLVLPPEQSSTAQQACKKRQTCPQGRYVCMYIKS